MKRFTPFRYCRCAVGFLRHGLFACLFAGSALADGELLDTPFEDLLDVTIESATKHPQRIRDIPASVTIITREEIARYGYATFEELLRNVPGLFMLDNTGERFVGSRGNVGGGIQFLVNGVPQHQSEQKSLPMPEIAYLNIPVESVDRVEVIRGPMSVVYGNNAFHGVVNVVTNAIDRHGSRVSAGLGNRDSGRLFLRAGKSFDDGFIVLNAGAYRTDGLEGEYADMMDANQLAAMLPGMHSGLDGYVDQQDYSLQLSAAWGDWNTDLRYTENHYGFYILTPGFDDGNRARVSTWHAALGWERAIAEDLGLRVNAVFSEERADAYQFDFFLPEVKGGQLLKSRRWEVEGNVLWDASPRLHLLAGYRLRLMDDIENRANVPPVVTSLQQVDSFTTHDFFSQFNWDVSETFGLSGGVRWSHLPNSYSLNGLEYPVERRDLLTGRMAALWSLDTDEIIKLMWGTASQDNGLIRFTEPERIETAEIVYLRTAPRWSLSASLFHNRTSKVVRRLHVLDPETGSYGTVADNSGEWASYGVELIGDLQPVRGLNLGASLTWQNTEDRKSDVEPGYSPHLLAKIKADYRRGPMTYALYGHYVSSMEADWDFVDGPTEGAIGRIGERVDGYWNLGANLRYQHPGSGLFANLNVSNLLDAEIRYPANELADFARGLIGPGRTVTATVGYAY
jgi:outer membrane receptor protein involved in Fe transport